MNKETSLTIACISVVGGEALQECLSSALSANAHYIIVADDDMITVETTRLIKRYGVTLLRSNGDTIPVMRSRAVHEATTEWIALIEDTCTIASAWHQGCRELMAGKDSTAGSGPVQLGSELSPRAQALFCSDYGGFISKPSSIENRSTESNISRSESLPGVNLLYRCNSVKPYIDSQGLIESEINESIKSDGHKLLIHEKLAVTLRFSDKTSMTLGNRFSHGRLYGGLQSRKMLLHQRLFRALACALLPALLSFRSLKALSHSGQSMLPAALFIVAFETVWSFGEFTGYILGAGDSLRSWK